MSYQDVQPRAVAIKEAVAERRMPPWGAVKGFGEFRNDQGLTQEQVELFTDWVEGGIAKGNNPRMLPEQPTFEQDTSEGGSSSGITIHGDTVLERSIEIGGLLPLKVPDRVPMQIVAALPNGRIEPLVWLRVSQQLPTSISVSTTTAAAGSTSIEALIRLQVFNSCRPSRFFKPVAVLSFQFACFRLTWLSHQNQPVETFAF